MTVAAAEGTEELLCVDVVRFDRKIMVILRVGEVSLYGGVNVRKSTFAGSLAKIR